MANEIKVLNDISKPNVTAATASSRPIIGHVNSAVDPMMRKPADVSNKPAETDNSSRLSINQSSIKTVAVLNNDLKIPSISKINITPTVNNSDMTELPSTEIETESEDSIIPKNTRTPDQLKSDKDQLVQKLVDEKTYFIKINESEGVNKKQKTGLLVGLFLFLLLGGYALADLNIIDLGFEVPMHFLGSKKIAQVEQEVAVIPAPKTITTKDKVAKFTYPSGWTIPSDSAQPSATYLTRKNATQSISIIYEPDYVYSSKVCVELKDSCTKVVSAIYQKSKIVSPSQIYLVELTTKDVDGKYHLVLALCDKLDEFKKDDFYSLASRLGFEPKGHVYKNNEITSLRAEIIQNKGTEKVDILSLDDSVKASKSSLYLEAKKIILSTTLL